MPLCGEGVGEFVKHERGLVTEHAVLLGPEPEGDEILVLGRGEVDEAQESTAGSFESAFTKVVLKQLARVAGVGRLP